LLQFDGWTSDPDTPQIHFEFALTRLQQGVTSLNWLV